MSTPTRTPSSSDSSDERQMGQSELVSRLERRAREEPDAVRAAALLREAAEIALEGCADPARAEDLLLRAESYVPGEPQTLQALARVRERAGDLPGVAAVLEQEADHTHGSAEAAERYLAVGRWWEERLGRRDRAALFYGRAFRLAPDLAEARRRAVACAESLGRYGHAKRLLDAWRDAGGDRAELAAAYARLGALLADEPLEHGLALAAIVEAMLVDRATPGAAETLDRLRAAPRTWREQASALQKRAAVERDRTEAARIWLRLAALHVAWDPDGTPLAREAFDRAWLASPGMAQALDLLERWHGERGDWPGLREELTRLAGSTRDLAAAVAANLRLAQLETVHFGDVQATCAALSRALDLDPANDEAALHLFEAYVDAGRDEEAISALERHLAARARRPGHAPLRLRAAELALGLGQRARAQRLLEAALREDPGFLPAARALLPLLEAEGAWPRLVELLEVLAAAERDRPSRASYLLRAAEIALEPLADPREAVRILSWALVTEPARLATRRQLEAAAARSGDFAELARAFRAGAEAAHDDLRTRKALLRRVAEIEEHDLAHLDEAARVWRSLADLDPSDAGAAAAYEAALARAGRHEELIADLRARLVGAPLQDRRGLLVRIARLHLEAGHADRSAAAWREILAEDGTDVEALRGLASALRAEATVSAADELCQVLARLSAQGAADRAELEAERAGLLLEPLERAEDAAAAWLALVEGGGLPPAQASQAVRVLEGLLARGIEPVRIARALAPVRAASGDVARHVEMLEVIARDESATSADRARMWLDVSALRQDRLGDTRGALDAAAAALREAPAHPEARRRVEDLATRARAFAELYAHLVQAADALVAEPLEERPLRIRAARLAEEELGSQEQATSQLRRARQLAPDDPEILASLTRLALAGERWEEARDLLREREALSPPEPQRVALLTQLGDLLLERMQDAAGAASAYRRALEAVPREQSARLLARLARALEASGDRAGLVAVLNDLADHPNVPPGLDVPAPPPPVDPMEKLALARERLLRDPHDDAAFSEVEAVASELDRPSDLAWAIEQRLGAALYDPDLAFRLAELRRTRLGDPAGALRLLAEVVAHAPDHPAAQQALMELARQPGAMGREALVTVDALLYGPGGAESRVALREDRLAAEVNPAEQARLHGELRSILEVDLADPVRALDAARGALACGGPARAEALADLPRLAEKAGKLGILAEVLESTADTAPAGEAVDLLRRAARIRDGLDDATVSIAAWRRLLRASPGDVEALEALDRILSRERRAADLAQVLAGLAEARRGDPVRRLEVLLRRAVLLEGSDDAQAAVDAFAAILEEYPRDGAALAGLARALSRPGSRSAAARLLERAYREDGDAGRLADVLEARLPDLDPAERDASLAEIAALREREGNATAAFDARARLYAAGRADPGREPALRDELVRIAAAAGEGDRLAAILEGAVGEGLPADAARAALRTLADGYRARERWDGLASALRRLTGLSPDPAEQLDLCLEAAEVLSTRLHDADGAQRSWREAASLLAARADDLAAREGGAREAADLRVREAAIRRERLDDVPGAVHAIRAALASSPRHAGALAVAEELGRDADVVAANAPFFGGVLAGELAAAEASGSPREADELRLRLADFREERLQDHAGALALREEVLLHRPDDPRALAGVERALGRDTERARAEAVLERAYAATGQHEKLAELLVRQLPLLGDAGGPVALRLGILHEGPLDRPAQAPDFYEAARRLDPSLAPRALAALERIYRKLDRPAELASVLDALAAAESRPEERIGILFVLAQLCEERLGSPARAADAYERVLEASPAHVASLRALGRLADAAAATDPDLAARLWRRLARFDPTDRRPLDALRKLQESRGDHAGLAETLRALAEADPPAARGLRLSLAETLLAGGDRDGAVAEARSLAATGTPSAEEEERLAAVFRGAGADDEAARLAESAARRLAESGHPAEAAQAWRAVAAEWSKRGRTAEAVAALGEALACAPSSRETFEALRALHAVAGDWGAWVRVTELFLPRAAAGADRAGLLEDVAEAQETHLADATAAWRAWRAAFRESPSSERAQDAILRLAPREGPDGESASLLAEAADHATGSRRAALLLRIAVARGVDGGDAAAGEEAVRGALGADPTCLDALAADGEGGADRPPPATAARLLAWGAAAGVPGDRRARLEAAHRLAPDDEGILASLETAVREAGDAPALASLLRRRADATTNPAVRAGILVSLGEALSGDPARAAEAEGAFREALEAGLPASEAVALHTRLALGHAAEPDAARADWERVLQLDPANLQAIRALQDARHRDGDRDGYATLLVAEARATGDAGRAAEALVEASRLHTLAGAPPEEVVVLLEEALRRIPGHRAAALALSETLEARGDLAGVARVLADAVPNLPADADAQETVAALCRLGRAREASGDAEGAMDAWQRARALDPSCLPALKGLGAQLARRGDWDEALPVLEAILAHHRDSLTPAEMAVTCGWVGQILERQGWSERAAHSFEKALEADPEHVPSLRGLARTLQARGDWSRAAGILERLLKMPEVQADPGGAAKLHVQLAEVLRDRVGDEDLALHHFELALDADPRLFKAFAAVESMLAGKRRWKDLARAYERMLARLPEVPELAKARTALWRELGTLQLRALGDRQAAMHALEQVVRDDPADLASLQSYAEIAAVTPGQEAAAAVALQSVAVRLKDPARAVSRLLALQVARKDLDRAYAAADVLAHLLRAASTEELETLDRLRRLAREFATRSLDDVLWQRLLHERLRGGPVTGILTLLARDAGSLFVQTPRDLGLNLERDEVDLAASGLVLANGIKYAARTLGVEGVRLFRVGGSPVRIGFANTEPPGIVAGSESYEDRPRRELWYVAARAVSFYRPELRLARLMPHDQLNAVFQAACSLGTPRFDVTADATLVRKLRGGLERVLGERGRLPLLQRLAEEYVGQQKDTDVRAHMDAVELTSNRAGALMAGDLQVARRLALEEKAQVSKLLDETKIRDLVQFCLSEDWAVLREALGLSVATR